ncbi:MAG: 4-hydroxybenzoate octaprenyltransferase [Pseudomonadota bacterium]
MTDLATPDAPKRSLVDALPQPLRSYARLARLDRPIGTWLLFWPCAWGVLLAGQPARDLYLLPLFFVGALAMRSAGCVYNDIVDRDLDARVERTRHRPVASGAVSVGAAWIFLILLSLVGLLVLVQLPPIAAFIALASLALVAAYPFMKRITWWPQAWLGLTFNWGALVGYAAVAGRIDAAALLLYAAGVFWTLGYDTIYALQDIEDDALAGIKSSARRLSEHDLGERRLGTGIAVFYILATAALATALVIAFGTVAAFPAVLLFGGHLLWQLRGADWTRADIALARFRSNASAGALAALAILIAALIG